MIIFYSQFVAFMVGLLDPVAAGAERSKLGGDWVPCRGLRGQPLLGEVIPGEEVRAASFVRLVHNNVVKGVLGGLVVHQRRPEVQIDRMSIFSSISLPQSSSARVQAVFRHQARKEQQSSTTSRSAEVAAAQSRACTVHNKPFIF
jgi:hypothetical protein